VSHQVVAKHFPALGTHCCFSWSGNTFSSPGSATGEGKKLKKGKKQTKKPPNNIHMRWRKM